MTDEKEVLAASIYSHIPRTATRLLDVGAGSGLLTGHLHALHPFSSMTLIEPSEDFCALLQGHFPQADIRKGKIETAELSGEYDVILASYVLPFVENPLETVRNLRNRLAPGGKLAIVQYDDQCGYADLVSKFRPMIHPAEEEGKFLGWEDIVSFLEAEEYPYTVEQVVTHIRPSSTEALYRILPFILDTTDPMPSEVMEQIDTYVRRFQAPGGEGLDIDAAHRCIIIDSGK